MTRMPPPTARGSILGLLIGVVLIVVALATVLIGFVRLITLLEAGGYGTPAMRTAFVVLGIAGALLAAGIATVIWDVGKRYEVKN